MSNDTDPKTMNDAELIQAAIDKNAEIADAQQAAIVTESALRTQLVAIRTEGAKRGLQVA
jgi:hypothetical protein